MQVPKVYLLGTLLLFALLFNSCGNMGQAEPKLTPIDSIRLSDPFILADKAMNSYFMTGTGGMVWLIRKAGHSMDPGFRKRNR